MSAVADPYGAIQQLLQAGPMFSSFASLGRGTTSPEADSARGAYGALSEKASVIVRDWLASHAELWDAMIKLPAVARQLSEVPGCEAGDRRFSSDAWSESPIYDYWRRAYLLNSHYLKKLSAELPVGDGRARERFDFLLRQYIDAISPANFAATNPEFVEKAIATKGESIQRAVQNLIRDIEQGAITTTDKAAFVVGKDLAATPGKVVFENELFQLLQYVSLTDKVAERPLLIIPPCINKYYILDLQEHNSFVRHAVEQGNTVFMVSWCNPGAAQGKFNWDDYIEQGVLKAIDVARDIGKVDKVNVLGFCVGGTMLCTALAVAAARGEMPACSLTLLAAMLDFSAPGDLGCFIDENLIAAKGKLIGTDGIFRGREMAGIFSSLRANDMIWQYVVNSYLKGEEPAAFDLLYWNADSTNLPGPFLIWYLRNMYFENSLCISNKLRVCGVDVDLGRIDIPAFVLATREDHIVPWQSAFRSAQLLKGEVTFTLGASGHIAGVINSARANKRSYWLGKSNAVDSEQWFSEATEIKGSWWMSWSEWLKASGGRTIAARKRLGNVRHKPLADAPGAYVLEKCE